MAKKKEERVMEITIKRRIVVEEKICPVCEKRFIGPKIKKFCGRLCLNKASYQKHAEARRAHRREVYRKQQGQESAGKKR